MTRTFIGCAIIALLLVRCSQQADADLATCKSDLTKARDDLTAAKTAQTTAEQRASSLEQKANLSNAQVLELQKAAQDAKSAEASSKPPAGAARKTAKPPSTPPAPLSPEERRRSKF